MVTDSMEMTLLSSKCKKITDFLLSLTIPIITINAKFSCFLTLITVVNIEYVHEYFRPLISIEKM